MAKKSTAKKPARKKRKVAPVPRDFPAISSYLVVSDVKKAADFYAKAFGFELKGPMMKAGRLTIHAALGFGKSAVMLGCPMPDGAHATPVGLKMKKQAFGLYVYVEDVDAHNRKVKRYKGVKVTEPQNTFWGDRTYDVVDRDGHHWTFASRVAKPTPEEMAEAMQQM